MFLSQDGHLEGVVAALCIFSNVEAMLVLAPMSTWASVGVGTFAGRCRTWAADVRDHPRTGGHQAQHPTPSRYRLQCQAREPPGSEGPGRP